MAIESRDILKTYFQTGDIPTQGQFANFIDSYVHRTDDGVFVYTDPGTGIKRFGVGLTTPANRFGVKALGDREAVMSLHSADVDSTHEWSFELNPEEGDGTNHRGFSIAQPTPSGMETRFFIDGVTGNAGIGTIEPTHKLHVEQSVSADAAGIKIVNTASSGNEGWIIGQVQSPDTNRDSGLVFIEGATPNEERVIICPGGNVGIGEQNPDTTLHVAKPLEDADSSLDLIEGTGVLIVGPITNNIVADHQGIQARQGEYIVDELNITPADLQLQPLGGAVVIHGDDSLDDEVKVVVSADGFMGIGLVEPIERLDIDGAIKLGTTENLVGNDGAIRFTGTDFEGRIDGDWVSLTDGGGGGGGGPWNVQDPAFGDGIWYANGAAPRVAIGTDETNNTLTVFNGEDVTNSDSYGVFIENASVNAGTSGIRVGVDIKCNSEWSALNPKLFNIGLMVSDVDGQVNNHTNMAALLNGNVVIGEIFPGGEDMIGYDGDRILAIQTGTPPGNACVETAQLYTNLTGTGEACLHVLSSEGSLVKLYTESALSVANNTTIGSTYDGSVVDIIFNMRRRINELEERLSALGFLPALP